MDHCIHVALALVNREGRWLVSRRAPGRVFAGLWEFPGGKVEPGESPAQAAVREAREEIGLVVESTNSLGEVATFYSGQHVLLHLVHCRVRGGKASACDPAVSEVRWLTLAELRQLPVPPATEEIIDKLACLDFY